MGGVWVKLARERDGCPDRIINATGATCLAKLLQLQLRLGYTHVTTRRARDKRMPSSIDGRSIIGKRQQEMRSLGRDGYRGRERGGERISSSGLTCMLTSAFSDGTGRGMFLFVLFIYFFFLVNPFLLDFSHARNASTWKVGSAGRTSARAAPKSEMSRPNPWRRISCTR